MEETVRLANLSRFVFRKTTEDEDYKGIQLEFFFSKSSNYMSYDMLALGAV